MFVVLFDNCAVTASIKFVLQFSFRSYAVEIFNIVTFIFMDTLEQYLVNKYHEKHLSIMEFKKKMSIFVHLAL